MANYTMTIAEMMNNTFTRNIFPSDYEFYIDDEQLRKDFEDKFIKYYYYREIGFETPFMFIQKLETHLLINMPYWKQLYQTELESRNINFLLNKDLKETFIREATTENAIIGETTSNLTGNTTNTALTQQKGSQSVSSENTIEGTNTTTTEGTSSTSTEGTTSTTHKESSLNDGVAQVSVVDGYLTGTSQDNGTSSQSTTDTTNQTTDSTSSQSSTSSDTSTTDISNEGNSSSTESTNTTGTNSQEENGKSLEKTELISQGNIGITSSAQLLKEWREVLINMDKIIIESCNDLFLKIY